jgi:hypothetical protein
MSFMAEKFEDEDDDDFDDDEGDAVSDGEVLDDFEDIDDKVIVLKDPSHARRRLEQLREEKELERLLRGDLDDWY